MHTILTVGCRGDTVTARTFLKRLATAVPLGLYHAVTRRAGARTLPAVAFTPADHRAHTRFHAEWWYFTSVLTTPGQHAPLGVEVTFFRIRTLLTTTVVHVAVTDAGKGRYVGTGVLLPVYLRPFRRTGPVLRFPGGRLDVTADGTFVISAHAHGTSVRLTCRGGHLVPQAPGGVQEMANRPGDASYYFTLPDMATEGEVVRAGERLPVSGMTWHDHQWGDFRVTGLKWDWFSLRFDKEQLYIMLFNFDQNGASVSSGTVTLQGRTVQVARVEARAQHRVRTRTGIVYPIEWDVAAWTEGQPDTPLLCAHVTPVLRDQYVSSLVMPDYWEGLCSVQGAVCRTLTASGAEVPAGAGLQGTAYVELTGYER